MKQFVVVIMMLMFWCQTQNVMAQSAYKKAYQAALNSKKAEKARQKEAQLNSEIATQNITFDDVGVDGQTLTYLIKSLSSVEVVQKKNYKKYSKVIIPDMVSYQGHVYTVRSIGEFAFWYCESLMEVIIPSSVTNISQYAFGGCKSLNHVVGLRNDIKMGTDVFKDCPYTYEQYANNTISLPPIMPQNQISENTPIKKVSSVGETTTPPVPKHSSIDINIPSGIRDNDNTFAIIIANENYQEEAKVEFALNDGEIFQQYCQKVLGLPNDNIHFRKDATLNNIRRELDWIRKVANAYEGTARIIVYYAGHGIPDEKTGAGYLLPVDGSGSTLSTGYSLSELYKMLGDLPAKDVIVFIDACFSGSKRGEGMLASARGVAIKAKPSVPKGKMVIFSAAQGDETAYPLKDEKHGMFTYYILKKLRETKGDVPLQDLSDYVITQVKRKSIVANGKSQTPTVNASPALGNRWKQIKLR